MVIKVGSCEAESAEIATSFYNVICNNYTSKDQKDTIDLEKRTEPNCPDALPSLGPKDLLVSKICLKLFI